VRDEKERDGDMANGIADFVFTLVVGFGLGLFYFGGLFLTLQRLERVRRPHFLVTGSYWLRLVITLFGFYWVANGHWERFLYCTAGWLIARTLLVYRMGPERADGFQDFNGKVLR
jgi:F1F0 ATPase subunit 2